jgi:NADH-quinone oxidoreductase subunit C
MTDKGKDIKSGQDSSAEMSSAEQAEHEARGGVVAGRARQGMFGVRGSGDTSGYGGLQLPAYVPPAAQRPYGGWFDEVTDELLAAIDERGVPAAAIQQVTGIAGRSPTMCAGDTW